MKRITLLISLIFMFGIILQAQQDSIPVTTQDTVSVVTPEPAKVKPPKEKKPRSRKVFFGGSLGLSFGSYTRIAVYPQIGYRITPKLTTGIELGYIYVTDGNSDYSSSSYGGSIYAQYRIFKPIYVHAEYATYNYPVYTDGNEYRAWVPFLFLGAGFIQKVGKSTHIFAQVKVDVLQNQHSIYGWDPLFRVGATVGF